MATCGHCKQPGQTVAHVRTCGQAGTVATAERPAPQLPDLAPGNVVTLSLEDGYWLVEATLAADMFQAARVQAHGRTACEFPLHQVEMVFPNLNSAAEYRIAEGALTAQEQISEALHGDPRYCRGCAKGWQGAKWHREDCPNIPAPQPVENNHHASGASLRENSNPWAAVNALRNQVKAHLHHKIRNAQIGHFAVRTEGVVKFYRVKLVTAGNWSGKVFVDAQASDDFHAVRSPQTLEQVLTAILADPHAAEELYGQELGQCYRCNRTLTDETSRALGIGPECRSKL